MTSGEFGFLEMSVSWRTTPAAWLSTCTSEMRQFPGWVAREFFCLVAESAVSSGAWCVIQQARYLERVFETFLTKYM